MTVVGKILVFLNLIFSLAVGAFAVMDYTARTHWADKYNNLSKKYQVVQADSQTWKAEAQILEKQKKDLNAQLVLAAGKDLEIKGIDDPEAQRAGKKAADLLIARGRQIEELKTDLGKLRDQLAAEKKKNLAYDTTATTAQADANRRQVDTEKLRTILKAETDKNIQLVRDMNFHRDQAVAAQIKLDSVRDMNKRLEGQLQEMARDMARLRANLGSAGGVARGVNPPPENVEGLVRRADGNLVTITIGSDAGLARGHTMEVFRLGANPRYIGRIKIVEVTPTQAVGQASGRMLAPMQVGDRVASRIMGGN
jgi:hypothetical protein